MTDDQTPEHPGPADASATPGTAPDGSDASGTTSGEAPSTTDGTAAQTKAASSAGLGGLGGFEGGPPPVKKRRNFFRRHLALTSLSVVLLLILGTAGGFVWYLNHELGNIPHINISIPKQTDSSGNTIPDAGHPLNILILGSDNGNDTQTVAQDLADGKWTPGAHRSDTIILVHIPANRQSAQIVSIPRDSWVPVPGFPGDVDGDAKINAAFSWGGPALAIKTIQDYTHLHIDHLATIDWNGFKDLTDALGGVRLYIPQTFTDDTQHVTWTKGWHTMQGDEALQYVRTRHGLANGDFGRIERQQNFLRTVMSTMLSSKTFTNPIKLARVIGTFSSFVEVDKSWSTSDIRSLAFALRNLRSSNVQFTTAPLGSYDVVAGQDIVRLDPTKSAQLFKDFNNGDLTQYLKDNPGSSLPSNTSVN